jgi:hypothetical protein
MDYGQIEAAYRRMFGQRWDKMTDEEKRAAMSDPKLEGRMLAQGQFAQQKRDLAYKKSWQQELELNRPKVVGTNAQTWG